MAPLLSCAGTRPTNLGIRGARLAPCPSSPNCVSSDADPADSRHYVPPFAIADDPASAFAAARDAVRALPRTRLVSSNHDYLHAECQSALLGFVDDLELHLRPGARQIAVRSASRLGYGDLGVNRKRIEELRAALRRRGALD